LNAIADRELRDKKVEYPKRTNMRMFPYEDWPEFIRYNIKDVLLQFGIERKTNDTMTYYKRFYINQTPYSKIFRETHLLRNVRELYFEKDGWIQGNNLNTANVQSQLDIEKQAFLGKRPDEDENEDDQVAKDSSFKGAIVADPNMNAEIGLPILGVPSNRVYRNTADQDMAAFYPSIKEASNMDPRTLVCKGIIPIEKYIDETYPNRSLNQAYFEKDKNGNTRYNDITGECVNGYLTGNILTFATSWLNAPTILELVEGLTE
jgi:hypothetical protein